MEVDDDFGDLYSDVLLPVASEPVKPASPPNPNSNLTHSPPAATAPAASSSRPGAGDKDDDWLLGGAGSPAVDPVSNWADDDEETNTNPSKVENPRASVSSPDQTIPGVSAADVADLDDPPPSIPGLNSANLPAASDDWDDSDSEDDLKIVLNDTEHGAMDEMMYEEGDEDEDLVIVTNDDQIGAMDQDWGEEGGLGAAGEGEGKEGDKVPGLGGTGGAPGASRVGYSNHGFHHSTYKYVRPGAPVPAGGPGAQGQVRPPLPAGPYPGRGRGEWRPAGGFRGPFNSWPNQNRPFGLDFSLPPQKTIFDFEIDSFEEKPWKYPGADLSDFFNFGLDEETWKDYCKRLGQLKIESTMQSKIRVYESGRSEPEFDPDLPPELAAATGQNEIIPENNMRSNGQVDFNNSQGSNSNRPQLPTGRAILVESSYAERLPSMDTRPARLRESDTIIEIVLQDSFRDDDDDGNNNGDVADKTEREESRDYSENDDLAPDQRRPGQRSPRRGSSNKRHSSPSSDEEESCGKTPEQKDINQNEKEDRSTSKATQEAATKDPSMDDSQSEQLVYSEPEDFNSVDQEAAEDSQSRSQSQSQSQSRSQSQSKNSLREREEEESCQRAATRSRDHRRSERDDDLAPHDRVSLPKVARASRKDGRMLGHFNHNSINPQHHYNNSHGGMKWRGHDEVFYHQQPPPPHQQQHYMHVRERDFMPHGFRGRSFERFNRGGFREEEGLERFNKGVRVYEREDDLGFRVRKRVEEREDEWRGVRKRERDDFVDVNFKRRKDEERRGKVEREDVWMVEKKRERERDREREESVIRVNNKDSRHREREERERERHKSKNILSHEREESRGGTTTTRISQSQNRNGSSTSRDEVKNEERERKLREKLLLNNNNNSNINNNSNLERGSSRHERDRYRDGGTRRSRAGTDNNNTTLDQRNPKRRHDDHKSGEQGSLKKLQVGPTSDEEEDSRRGRSKMERWNSHKEREDFTPVNKLDVSSSNPTGEDPAEKANLDTVERLKRRSERFKVPLHGDKERDGEGELTGQSQSQSQMEVKPERPARKRRWTGS